MSTFVKLTILGSLAIAAQAGPLGARIFPEAPLVALEALSSAQVLLSKDFSADLPEDLRTRPTTRKTASISIDDHGPFRVLVHYDQVNDHTNFFKKVEVELPTPVAGVNVAATLGHPVNVGTSKDPVMAVPLLVQWSGEGWLRTEQWTLHPDGRLQKSP